MTIFAFLCANSAPSVPLRLVFLFLVSSLPLPLQPSTFDVKLPAHLYFVTSLLLSFYRNPVVLQITTPQTASIPKLTTLRIPAATQPKSIRGTPAIDAK
jgi:hypothetical protein